MNPMAQIMLSITPGRKRFIRLGERIMVCEVCSIDRSDDDGDSVILDYPRFLASEQPCPNCGGVGAVQPKKLTLSDLTALAIARRNSRSAVPQAAMMDA